MLRLWRPGDHRIIERLRRRVFAPQTAFSRLELIGAAGDNNCCPFRVMLPVLLKRLSKSGFNVLG
jgi:hypothetical protein